MSKYLKIAAFALVFSSLPVLVFASFPNFTGPLVTCSANPIPVEGLPNGQTQLPECQSFCDLLATSRNIIDVVLTYVIMVIAPAVFIWGGFLVAVSGGNPSLRSKGMGYMKAMAFALLIIVGSYVIVNTFITALNLKQGQGFIQGFTGPIECSVPNTTTP